MASAIPYDTFLHRSFDYQLSPTPSTIIDWAPIRQPIRVVLNNSPYEPVHRNTTEKPWLCARASLSHTAAVAPLQPRDSSPGTSAGEQNSTPQPQHSGARSGSSCNREIVGGGGGVAQEEKNTKDGGETSYQNGGGGGGAAHMASWRAGINGAGGGSGSSSQNATVGPAAPFSSKNENAYQTSLLVVADDLSPSGPEAGGMTEAVDFQSMKQQQQQQRMQRNHHYGPSSSPDSLNGCNNIYATASDAGGAGQTSRSAGASSSFASIPVVAPFTHGWGSLVNTLKAHLGRDAPPQDSARHANYVYSSYGAVPVYSSGSFSAAAALWASIGWNSSTSFELGSCSGGRRGRGDVRAALRLTGGGGSGGGEDVDCVDSAGASSSSDLIPVGKIRSTQTLRALNVAQLSFYYGKRHWSGMMNVQVMPLPLGGSRIPRCEGVLHTPWTEFSLQLNRRLVTWCGFLTLYQECTPSTVAAEGAATVAASTEAKITERSEIKEGVVENNQSKTRQRHSAGTADPDVKEDETRSSTSFSSVQDVKHSGKITTPVAESLEGKQAGKCHSHHPPHLHPSNKHDQTGTTAAGAAQHDVKSESAGHEQELVPAFSAPSSSLPLPPLPSQLSSPSALPTVRWWKLRQLKVGAGVSLKNDLATGINLYWGCSGRMGNGLSFSGHIDVLRRACCAVSSSLGPLDMSVRLRMNMITLHGTALDAGLSFQPMPEHFPNTAVRLSSTTFGNCAGVHVKDITHEWLGGWIDTHRQQRLSCNSAESDRSESVVVSHGASTAGSTKGEHTASLSAHAAAASEEVVSANHVEGSWISLGLASSVWGYVRSVLSSASSSASSGTTTSSADLMAGSSSSSTVQGLGGLVSMPGGGEALPGGESKALEMRWWKRWVGSHSQQVTSRAVQAHHTVSHCLAEAWHHAKQLDWAERLLDTARVDVSVGVVHDPSQAGSGWRSFLVLSAH